jgi:prepilin-type N-terminal cleavage/methylation domain-containing protein
MAWGKAREARGFTLIEVMVAVAIVGVLATLAIPAFLAYMAKSKTAEASQNLDQLYKLAAVYYVRDLSGKGITSNVTGHCITDSADREPTTPDKIKQAMVISPAVDPELSALRFTVADLVYFSYGFNTPGGGCGMGPNTNLYTFFANGDLDGDGTWSTFEVVAASNSSNEFYHGRGLYIANEIE